MQRLVDIAPTGSAHLVPVKPDPDPEVPVLTITDLGMVRSVTAQGEGWVIGLRQPIQAARRRNTCLAPSATP